LPKAQVYRSLNEIMIKRVIIVGMGFKPMFMQETNADYTTFHLKRMLVTP